MYNGKDTECVILSRAVFYGMVHRTGELEAEINNLKYRIDMIESENISLRMDAKALELLREMVMANEVVEISTDGDGFFVQRETINPDDFHYSTILSDAILSAYKEWQESEK